MTSRERVKRTLTFNYPDRPPRDLWILPIALKKYKSQVDAILEKFPLDIEFAKGLATAGDPTQEERWKVGSFTDEWGCVFKNVQEGIVGQVKDPIIKKLSDVKKVRPPYHKLKEKVNIEKINKLCEETDKFVLGGDFFIDPFERMQFLRGTSQLYMDIVEQPPGFFKLMDIVHEYNLTEIELWTKTKVDGILFADDWGSQKSLLINPKLWRKLFKPLYKEYCERIHSSGKFVFMHSDGYIFDIYEDLIEIGVDALNSQLFCMDIEQIGKKFKGKITFWGEIDRQHILPSPNIEDVKKAVEEIKKFLYDRSGGIIVQCEFGAGARPENVEAIFKEWEKV